MDNDLPVVPAAQYRGFHGLVVGNCGDEGSKAPVRQYVVGRHHVRRYGAGREMS